MHCHDCIFFSDLGRCRNGRAKRQDVGYFDKSCNHFIMANEKETTIEVHPHTKVCAGCGKELPLESFSKNPHGYTRFCKECMGKKRGKKSATAPSGQEGSKAPLSGYETWELTAELKRRGFTGRLTHLEEYEI